MKAALLSLLLIFTCCAAGYAQAFRFADISLNGLAFVSDKQIIMKQFGKPEKIMEPDYECGFYSAREQAKTFYQLYYGPITFIGNDADRYSIETIELLPDSDLKLKYGNYRLTSYTTIKDFGEIFGETALKHLQVLGSHESVVTLLPANSDDGLLFFFKNNLLVRVTYYSPC